MKFTEHLPSVWPGRPQFQCGPARTPTSGECRHHPRHGHGQGPPREWWGQAAGCHIYTGAGRCKETLRFVRLSEQFLWIPSLNHAERPRFFLCMEPENSYTGYTCLPAQSPRAFRKQILWFIVDLPFLQWWPLLSTASPSHHFSLTSPLPASVSTSTKLFWSNKYWQAATWSTRPRVSWGLGDARRLASPGIVSVWGSASATKTDHGYNPSYGFIPTSCWQLRPIGQETTPHVLRGRSWDIDGWSMHLHVIAIEKPHPPQSLMFSKWNGCFSK